MNSHVHICFLIKAGDYLHPQ